MMKNKYLNVPYTLLFTLFMLGLLAGCASTSKPGASDKEVSVWANEALLTTFNYDYANYQRQLQAASVYYTPEAWQAYLLALETSGNLKTVIKKKMLTSAVAQGAPIILSEGPINNQYSWKLQIPMLLTYENAFTHQKQPVLITLLILRTNDQLGVRGLAIQQLAIQGRGYSQLQHWRSK